ncbi:MAG: hypothetical protein OXU61_02540, partial [Gammaproteobacteria bacterium]|nr:hypothetical protein [Gammaproteobacteria bacterium]
VALGEPGAGSPPKSNRVPASERPHNLLVIKTAPVKYHRRFCVPAPPTFAMTGANPNVESKMSQQCECSNAM